jgi:transposase
MTLPPSLRFALVAHRPGRGKQYAPSLRSAVVEFAHKRRSQGASWKEIAGELGMRFETVVRWSTRASSRSLKRIEVVDEGRVVGGGLSIVSPSGHRLEGLTVQDAIAVLRALG